MTLQTKALKKHSKSFYWAGMLLPRKTLESVGRLYAFCREMDDAIDELHCSEIVIKSQEAHKSGEGEISDLITHYCIPYDVFACFMEALQKDISPVNYKDMGVLLQFCYGVAGTVGVMMCHILGRNDNQTNYFAIDLGIAMQLVNIARDRHEDQGNNRYYIPDGHTQQSLIDHAEAYFQSGIQGIYALPFSMRPAIMTAAFMYRDIGRLIQKDPAYARDNRVFVSKPRKLWLTMCALYAVFFPHRQADHNLDLHQDILMFPHTHQKA